MRLKTRGGDGEASKGEECKVIRRKWDHRSREMNRKGHRKMHGITGEKTTK